MSQQPRARWMRQLSARRAGWPHTGRSLHADWLTGGWDAATGALQHLGLPRRCHRASGLSLVSCKPMTPAGMAVESLVPQHIQ
jgi:hypothetical protein